MGVDAVGRACGESAGVPVSALSVAVVRRGPSLPRVAHKSGQDRRAAMLSRFIDRFFDKESHMKTKQLLQSAAVVGLVALAACAGPIGPSTDCSYDPDTNATLCSQPEALQLPVDEVAQ